MAGPDNGSGAVVFFETLVLNQALLAEFPGHWCPRIGRGMLDIGPVDIAAGEFEIGFDRLAGVAGISDNQSADYEHVVAMQIIDGLQCRIARFMAIASSRVLGRSVQKFEIAFENVLDPEKDIAKSGLFHQGSKAFSVVCDG